jgi:Fe-S-cluster formation regulator IscX/YfhJ
MLAADDGKAERELKRAAAKLDPRFVDFVERTERTVEQLERAEVLLPTGFALDGAILRNQQGETVDPETLRGTSVGTTA